MEIQVNYYSLFANFLRDCLLRAPLLGWYKYGKLRDPKQHSEGNPCRDPCRSSGQASEQCCSCLKAGRRLRVRTAGSDGVSPSKNPHLSALPDTLPTPSIRSIDQRPPSLGPALEGLQALAYSEGSLPPRRRCLADNTVKHTVPESHRAVPHRQSEPCA